MEEVRNALVAISEGSRDERGGCSQSNSQLLKGSATSLPHRVVHAPRTSFTYTSRRLPQGDSTGGAATTLSLSAVSPHHTSSVDATGHPASLVGSSSAAATVTVSARVADVMETRGVGVVQRHPMNIHTKIDSAASSPPPPPLSSLPSLSCSTSLASCAAFSRMDESQIRAATQPADAALILQAGAGSGKTQTMAARIAYLLQSGVPGHSILGICFTRQAAETLRERVRSTLPSTLTRHAHALKLKTFHAFGLECLRRFGALSADTHVLDARQQYHLARRVVDTYAQREKSSEAVADLVDYVNRAKTMKVPPMPQSDPGLQDAYLFPYYQQALHEEHNAVDFGDLQQMFYELLRPVPVTSPPASGGNSEGREVQRLFNGEPQPENLGGQERLVPSQVCSALRAEYTHFVVDEFQDFNEIQVELLALLAGDACRVTCVGDPNQCIYTWRGAMPNVFGVWKKRFPQTAMLTLAMNYRSDAPIVEAANSVVKATQLAHHHREERAVTLVQCVNEDEELQAVPLVIEDVLRRRDAQLGYGDIAILCRSRRRVQLYYDVLQSHRIPVKLLKGLSVDHLGTMRSLLAFLRLCVSPHSPEGDSDVRTVLNAAPLHRLPTGTAKKFTLSLESVCQARRATEAAQIRSWRHTLHTGGGNEASVDNKGAQGPLNGGAPLDTACDSAAAGGGFPAATTPGVHPETHSLFAVLQELVYHNFSREMFPKLEVSKKNQKNLRSIVRIVLHAKELLAQPSCDVEQVLRYVLREGGYESDSMATVAVRTAATSRVKRARDSVEGQGGDGGAYEAPRRNSASTHKPCVGSLLMDQCVLEHSLQRQRHAPSAAAAASSCSSNSARGGGAWNRRYHASRRLGAASGGDGDVDSSEEEKEEAALWREQRMNLSELVLHTYRSVQEALHHEVAYELGREGDGGGGGEGRGEEEASLPRLPKAGGTDDSISNLSNGSTTTAMTAMQALRPPPLVLRRVLDEFVSLVSSDDYGPLRGEGNEGNAVAEADAAGNSSHFPANTSSRWIGKVTVGTVHSAKGMEWPAVLLPGCWVGEYPVRPREEERRIFYVGISRAMKHLVCFTAAMREGGAGSGQESTAASAVDDVPFQHAPTGSLEPTPYLAAFSDKLERVTYADLKSTSLKERGYT
ncbi:hypothetical protein JKF63_06861 [Porcisia hertigi]|uniref:DNA 3'-5' helicase n=1 Tax=Porcisia hertigi TaxID=2761500 RepID=A0A836LJ87_9TRYP|nr:hypothetical protein JKF63_06861 [Porcisia hertigi]